MDKLEKLKAALEGIKVPLSLPTSDTQGQLQSAVVAAGDAIKTKKNQRIAHCRGVTDAVCNSTSNSKLLGTLTEALLSLCDDSDADIRLVASECLNRIVRSMKDRQLHEFQVEILKEMKKGRSTRSLRAALNLFAYLSPQIRPQKCRVFAQNIASCFSEIANRDEDLLYDSLAACSSAIFKNLGPFLNDEEIKNLCDAYLVNLSADSIAKRRASASILVSICQFSCNPSVYIPRLLQQVTDILAPNVMEKSSIVIIGSLLFIHQALVPIYEHLRENYQVRSLTMEQQFLLSNIVKIYEICMILCNHDDHNVVTTSLETLQFILTSPPQQVFIRLDSPLGLSSSYDIEKIAAGYVCEGKRMDVYENIDKRRDHSLQSLDNVPEAKIDRSLMLSSTITLEGDADVPTFKPTHNLSTSAEDGADDFEIDDTAMDSDRNSDIFCMANASEPEGEDDGETLTLRASEEQTESSMIDVNNRNATETIPELSIGSLFEKQRPILYCARFLAYNFLLSGRKGCLRSESESRVSVKVLAMNCINQIIALRPGVFFLALRADQCEDRVENEEQYMNDLCLYSKHSDPMLRCCAYSLIGIAARSILHQKNGSFGENDVQMLLLINTLPEALHDSSNLVVRRAISAISTCISDLWRSAEYTLCAENLFFLLLEDFQQSYWLVKVEFVNALSAIQFDVIPDRKKVQKMVLKRILKMLGDEDHRVRKATISSLILFIENSAHGRNRNCGIVHSLCENCVKLLAKEGTEDCCYMYEISNDELKEWLEIVLNMIKNNFSTIDDKHTLAGCFGALFALSQRFKPHFYQSSWRCGSGSIPLLLELCLDYAENTFATDLLVHSDLLLLASELFKASTESLPYDKYSLFVNCDKELSIYGLKLLRHALAVLKLYYNAMKNPNEAQPKKVSSPISASGKKIAKPDNEKKQASDGKFQFKYELKHTTQPAHFEKLVEVVQQNWKLFKSSLDASVEEKFTSLLKAAWKVLADVCYVFNPESGDLDILIHDVVVIAMSIFRVTPKETFSWARSILHAVSPTCSQIDLQKDSVDCVENDIESFMKFWQGLESKQEELVQKMSSERAITEAIQHLQPIIVAALKNYTTSNNAATQADVLELMSELINCRICYEIVDPEDIFIKFIKKQVGYLSLVNLRNSDVIINNLFKFMVLLCHTKIEIMELFQARLDLEEVLNHCKVFHQAGRPFATHGIPAVRHVLPYLGLPPVDFSERCYLEQMKRNVFPLLLDFIPEIQALPLVLSYVQGSKNSKDIEIIEESNKLITKIITSVMDSKFVPRTRVQHECILAILSCCSIEALPTIAEIQQYFRKSLHIDNSASGELQIMIMTSIYNCVIFIRHQDMTHSEIPKMVIQMWDRVWQDVTKLFPHTDSNQADFAAGLLKDFIQVSIKLFKMGNGKEFANGEKKRLYIEPNFGGWRDQWLNSFKKGMFIVAELSKRYPFLRKEMINFLYALEVSDEGMELVRICYSPPGRKEDLEEEFLTCVVTSILIHLEHSDHAEGQDFLVRYLVKHTPNTLTTLAATRIGKNFLKSLDGRQCTVFYNRKKDDLIDSALDFELIEYKNFVDLMKNLRFVWRREIVFICLKLLKTASVPFLTLQISHYASSIFDEMITQNDCTLNKDELQNLKEFISEPRNISRFPRLVTIGKIVEANNEDGKQYLLFEPEEVQRFGTRPIHFWCTEEIKSSSEGYALVKMLNTLEYESVMMSFQNEESNHGLIPFTFRYLRKLVLQGMLNSTDLMKLMSDKRNDFRTTWPIAVAGFDYVLSSVKHYDATVPDRVTANCGKDKDFYLYVQCNYRTQSIAVISLCESLGEIFKLKALLSQSEQAPDVTRVMDCYMTPRLMAYLLFLFRAKVATTSVSVNMLSTFLSFVGDVFEDLDFMHLFNASENADVWLSCAFSLDVVFRHIMDSENTDILPCQYADPLTKDDYCFLTMRLFHQLAGFVASVQKGDLRASSQLLNLLLRAVRGLARCDVLNSRILMSHLELKSESRITFDEFLKRPYVPIHVFQTDKDGLVKHIQMLKLYGIGSKKRFEETWMNLLWAVNSYEDKNGYQERVVILGIRAVMMLLDQTVQIEYQSESKTDELVKGLAKIDLVLEDLEPELCKKFKIAGPITPASKIVRNKYNVDLKSFIHSFFEFFNKGWFEVEKQPPLIIFTEVTQAFVQLSEHFDDPQHYQWLYNVCLKYFKGLEKDDECVWPHLIQGIFISAAKIDIPETEFAGSIGVILEDALSSQYVNVSNMALKSALVYLQSNPTSTVVINLVLPHLMKNLEAVEGIFQSESRLYITWELLLFIWIYAPSETAEYEKLDKDLIGHIFPVLSPMNKTYVSVRLLVLKNLKRAVELGILKSEAKVRIGRLVVDVMKTPNPAILFEAIKLFTTMFYFDFKNSHGTSEPDPEVLMQMKERCEPFFQILKSGKRFSGLVASKVFPIIVRDFLPPFEILNRVISEFLLPQQRTPELMAPIIAQIFEKARGREEEMTMVSEWIKSSLPNFMSCSDISRTIWNMTFFFVGISKNPEIQNLLPFAELKRGDWETKKLFVHVAIDYYKSVSPSEKEKFKDMLRGPIKGEESPYKFLLDLMTE